jgi:hypothetical protein
MEEGTFTDYVSLTDPVLVCNPKEFTKQLAVGRNKN